MAGALRHSCTSCTRYLSPARSTRSLHAEQGIYSSLTPPASPKRIPPQPVPAEPYISHVRSKSTGFVPKIDHAPPKRVDMKQLNSLEGARHLSSYKKPAIDLPSFLQILSVLNIDLPRYFPEIIKRKDMLESGDSTKKNVTDAKTTSAISKDDSLDNLQYAERKVDLLKRKELLAMADCSSVNREKHDLAEALDAVNHGMSKSYFSAITFPEMKAPSSSDVNIRDVSKAEEQPNTKTYESKDSENKANPSLVKQIRNYIPYGASNEKNTPADAKNKKKAVVKPPVITQSEINKKTRGLVQSLRCSTQTTSQLRRAEELCSHIAQYPETKSVALKEGVVGCLLKLRQDPEPVLQEIGSQGLSLVGYHPPVRGRGIRILALDGGGTKGLVSIDLLKKLEEVTGKKIHELFDYVCGVSTGSLIATLAVVHKLPMEKIEHLYKEFSTKVFSQNRIFGMGKLVTSQAYYNSNEWENILKKNLGEELTFLETMKDATTPKLSVVACLTNRSKIENFLFRNYNHPMNAESYYLGSCNYKLWEAIRASSAAPTYFEEYKLDDYILEDGGVLTNNPTSLAITESQDLWPKSPIQCVVSIGTGKYESVERQPKLYGKINHFVDSATDTEAVHITMHRLLPPGTYFRFNPYLSENCNLDEVLPEKWELMKQDTNMYCRKNDVKIKKAAEQLLLPKHPHERLIEWVKVHTDTQEYFKKS